MKNESSNQSFLKDYLELIGEASQVERMKNDSKDVHMSGYTFKLRHMPAKFYLSICSMCPHPSRTRKIKGTKLIEECPAFLTYEPTIHLEVNGQNIWHEPIHKRGGELEHVAAEMLLILEAKETKEGEDNHTGTLKALNLL